ncbi:MAG: hypothetical protein ACXAC8_14350 [Candidatus Hodarchaeales archaeon]
MKEVVNQIRSVVTFCGYEIESIVPHKLFVALDLKSKKRFRKRKYSMAISKSLNGLLTAERELSRQSKDSIIIFDPVNNLQEPTFDNVTLVHDFDSLQGLLHE